ncbi:hypothetical protein JCM6882_004523 [Rhodosporidiobolus microsporus]
MAPEASPAAYPLPSSSAPSSTPAAADSASSTPGSATPGASTGPSSLPPVGLHLAPTTSTSQPLPGVGHLDAAGSFYASTSTAPYPPGVAPAAYNPPPPQQQQQHGAFPGALGGASFPFAAPSFGSGGAGGGGGHSPYPGYPPTPFSAAPSFSPAPQVHHYDPFSLSSSSSHSTPAAPSLALPPISTVAGPGKGGHVPSIGSIRCYWVVLSPALEFVFLDPIMQHHLGEWGDKLVGTSLLDWVHPEDREQLGVDLLPAAEGQEGVAEGQVGGVESGGVFGSVTRLRYSRMVRVLRNLGCPTPPSPPDASVYAIDSEWLNLDLTTSWIAGDRRRRGGAGGGKGKGKGKGREGKGGAVLAFFHASEDKDAVSDNDSQNRTEWTNWCGPAVDYPGYLTPPQCEALVRALERVTLEPGAGGGDGAGEGGQGEGEEEEAEGAGEVAGPPPHVFQILDAHGRPIVTFPRSDSSSSSVGGGEGEKAEKGSGSYDVEQFSMLAREVMARPRETIASKTSCTRRYRSKHPVMKDGTLTTIESVVVMYGAITFACFQTGGIYLRPTTTSNSSSASSVSAAASASVTPASTAGRKGRLSLITNSDHFHHPPPLNAGAMASDFALEDVPPTTPVVGTPHPNGNGKRTSVGGGGAGGGGPGEGSNGAGSKGGSMSPPNKRFKPTVSAPAPPSSSSAAPATSQPQQQQPQQPLSGLSIMTGGRLFRNSLDVEAITAGGISPTVASASAILGSFSADAHQLAQQQQQQQSQQQPQSQQQGQQQFSPNVTNSPSTQSSYSTFYNNQPPQLQHQQPQPPSFSPFDPPQISYSQPHPTPPLYSHAPSYSPHPLSQSHPAASYFSPAPVSPHPDAHSSSANGGSYPPPSIATSQPFTIQSVEVITPGSEHPASATAPLDLSGTALPAVSFSAPPPPAPPGSSAPLSLSLSGIITDPAQIPVPPPPPPHSQSGKKPPKQRPDGPVFKPNVKACESCGTVNSPEWRKGPTGAKSLCNACGLRYARSVARQKKQAEAAANGGVVAKGKKKKPSKAVAAAAAAQAAAADKVGKANGSPEGSNTPSLPPHSQPSPVHTSLPGGYDLSAYARASPKPYTPYHTSAPAYAGSFAPVMHSPTTSQPSPFHSPLPPATSSAYFPAMAYSAAPPFSGAPLPLPVPTHTPLPPPPGAYGDYSRSTSFSSHPGHLPGITSSHFPSPHLHSPHLEHPPQHQQQQHSPHEPSAPGMFHSLSQGSQGHGSGQGQGQQPSYQPYDWRHEQAEGGGQGQGQDRQEGQ